MKVWKKGTIRDRGLYRQVIRHKTKISTSEIAFVCEEEIDPFIKVPDNIPDGPVWYSDYVCQNVSMVEGRIIMGNLETRADFLPTFERIR
jgi:hypothetical protein